MYRLKGIRAVPRGTLGLMMERPSMSTNAYRGGSDGGGGGFVMRSPVRITPMPPIRRIVPRAVKPVPVKPKPVVTSKPPVVAKPPVVVVTGSTQTGLQAAIALLASNPCGLNPAQWSLLQNNGDVANTLPFSSACLISPTQQAAANDAAASGDDPQCVAAGMTGGPYPNCTAAAAGSLLTGIDFTSPTTWPWWMWGGIGMGGYLAFRKKGRGRR